MKWILCFITACLLISCGTVDVAKVRERIDTFEASVPTLQAAATQLRELAERTNKPEAIAAAANAEAALKFTVEQIPLMEAELEHLQDQAPWWKVAIAASWPLIGMALKLIPGPGGAVATTIAEFLYRANASRDAKERDKKAHAALAVKEAGVVNAPG